MIEVTIVIKSFADRRTADIWRTGRTRGSPPADITKRKLGMLDVAVELQDLKCPPGNRLEKLKVDRAGSHSIRVNQQWRICFRWTDAGAEDVELVDYH